MPKKITAKKSATKKTGSTIKKTVETSAAQKIHPWRVCPAGQHYRQGTTVRPHMRNGQPVAGGPRSGTCADNPSGKDQLYPIEMTEIAELHFEQFKLISLGSIEEFKKSSRTPNAYDYLIQGWTRYWNDVLKPNEPLDPKLIKALIASESGFNPAASNKKKGPNRARGLMQVTDGSTQYMNDDHPEFTDHFLNLTEDNMLDPNLAICAGVRWLYRKRQLASVKLGKQATWIEAVAEYKSYLKPYLKDPNHVQMRRFILIYEELKNAN